MPREEVLHPSFSLQVLLTQADSTVIITFRNSLGKNKEKNTDLIWVEKQNQVWEH